MRSHFFAPLLFGLTLSLAACGSTADDPAASNSNVTPGGDSGTTPTTGTKFKTHVILGDSISDGGGEAPFYYNLLDKNDDAKWPDATGKDFSALYGADIKIVKASKGGSKGQNLGSQISLIPATLEGPVLVTMTIGGNDVQSALGALLTTGDDSKQRADFQEFLDAAVAELTKPDRFGPGVKVAVYMTNVYDPSDGNGNFTVAATGKKCPGALAYFPAGRETKPLLDPWDKIFTDVAAKYPGTKVVDLRSKYDGHGVAATDSWFVGDCIHPNAKGHDAIRDLFWEAVTK